MISTEKLVQIVISFELVVFSRIDLNEQWSIVKNGKNSESNVHVVFNVKATRVYALFLIEFAVIKK